ncbi:O-methyltransferase [Streptomyces mashuensis]|uniref:O-methyltransferase n=1 Tax=Streptomyces mashuensis TaxID=33904 RepID=A0A919EEL4_9ACTN|nr:methyltransferase [Streptomyces mashuensis]GHF65505.1 O-methyltransferase [Streptomyces mashuensis]
MTGSAAHVGADTSTPAGILRLANAFCDAKALLSAVELGLFGTLREGPLTCAEITAALSLQGRGVRDWLQLLVGLGLLERDDRGGEERYRNAPGAARHLVPGGDAYVGGFLQRSNRNLYPAWGRLTEALRTGKPQAEGDFWAMVGDPRTLRQFADMMDALTEVLGPQLLAAYDGWASHRSLLDLGGCRGALAARIVAAHPHLEGHVVDLPQLEPLFDEKMAGLGLTDKVTFHPGDFFTDPLPQADVVVLGHALHDWSAEKRRLLVHKAFGSVRPGGVLLVYDRMLDEDPRHDAPYDPRYVENLVISLDMLLVTDGGSEYTVAELRGHAEEAGFGPVTARPLGDYDTLVVCRRPGPGTGE